MHSRCWNGTFFPKWHEINKTFGWLLCILFGALLSDCIIWLNMCNNIKLHLMNYCKHFTFEQFEAVICITMCTMQSTSNNNSIVDVVVFVVAQHALRVLIVLFPLYTHICYFIAPKNNSNNTIFALSIVRTETRRSLDVTLGRRFQQNWIQ